MKRVVVLALTGAAFLTASTAFSGQDETQIRQTDRVMQAKRAAQAAPSQRGIAGPVGPEGKMGPGGKTTPATSLIGHPTHAHVQSVSACWLRDQQPSRITAGNNGPGFRAVVLLQATTETGRAPRAAAGLQAQAERTGEGAGRKRRMACRTMLRCSSGQHRYQFPRYSSKVREDAAPSLFR